MTLDKPDAGLWPRWYQSSQTDRTPKRLEAVRSAFSRLQFYLWSRREISLRPKGRVYQAVVNSILILQLRDVVSTSRKWNGAGGFWQWPRPLNSICEAQRLGSAFVLLVYRDWLSEEGFVGLVTLRDFLRMRSLETSFCLNQIVSAASELEACWRHG